MGVSLKFIFREPPTAIADSADVNNYDTDQSQLTHDVNTSNFSLVDDELCHAIVGEKGEKQSRHFTQTKNTAEATVRNDNDVTSMMFFFHWKKKIGFI